MYMGFILDMKTGNNNVTEVLYNAAGSEVGLLYEFT